MKYHAQLTREDGKTVGLAGNECIDIDIKDGNRYIARLTVREGKVYDEQDNELFDSYKGSKRESDDIEAREYKSEATKWCERNINGICEQCKLLP